MTSEDERSESSEKASGEELSDDPRASEDRPAGDPRERSSGEGGEPRESQDDGETSELDDGETSELDDDRPDEQTEETSEQTEQDDDIPLNIAGHDEEKRRREAASESTTDGAPETGDDDQERLDEAPETADDEVPEAGQEGVLSSVDISDPRADDEVEPVELLVQMAEDGEIDPWDIDVVTVTDKFLDRLDEADLRTGGRALFYASVLLRMKSDAMWHDEPDEEDWEEPEPWEVDGPAGEDGEPLVDPFDELEREMDRRIERKRARGMPETLDELVRDLRERERDTWWKESRTYDTSESPSGYSRGTQTLDYHTGDDRRMDDEPTAHDVTGTTHDEHMEDIINDVYVALQNHFEQGRDEVLFAEIREAGGSVVNTFLGVLFLSHRGQIRLQQDELFGDLWVQDPAAVPAEEPVTADD